MHLTNRAALLATLILMSLLGCSRSAPIPTQPRTRDGRMISVHADSPGSEMEFRGPTSFYPFNVGNRWTYEDHESKVWIVSGDTIAAKSSESSVQVVQSQMEEINGRMYMREEIRTSLQPGQGIRWRREDRTGLYELGSSPFGEERLLAYPLQVGATWALFPASHVRITATVEGNDVLETPAGRFPAWRIRISGRIAGSEIVWYGRSGYLGLRDHDQSVRPDSAGLHVVYDGTESLVSLSIQRGSRGVP